MALLVAFTAAMLAMYFFKMRRAAALFGSIEPGSGPPPPGSSPPLGGGTGSPLSPGGKTPRAGGSSPLSRLPSPVLDATGPEFARTPSAPKASALSAKRVGRLRIDNVIRETSSVETFRLRSPAGGALPFTFTPGQFLNIAFGIGSARMNRSYSVSSSPNERN